MVAFAPVVATGHFCPVADDHRSDRNLSLQQSRSCFLQSPAHPLPVVAPHGHALPACSSLETILVSLRSAGLYTQLDRR